ncbi:MAG: site-specific integrase [Rhodocyclaceae bacterium]|nr:site-specific integrase [Rhodocyclaceae bacterium]
MRWSLLVRNPAGLAELPRRVRRKPQVFNSSQARKFIQEIQGHRLEALFLVTLCTGMREGEVLALGLDDLDLDGQRLRIRGSLQRVDGKLELVSTKTEESQRSVLLPTLVVAALRKHLARREQERAIAGDDWEESGRVFVTRRGTFLDARNMLRDYYKLRDGSDLPAIRFHDLRHSAASLLHAAGVPSQAIRKLLGHASVRTTQEVYSHVTTDLESAAADKMDAILNEEKSA